MNKVILITGGSRGIGASIARLAAQRGYTVCISFASNKPAAEALLAEIDESGGRAAAFQADVSCEADVLKLFSGIDTRFGRLDALVNNAGILDIQMRVEDMSADRIERVFATNVVGSFLCAREGISPKEETPCKLTSITRSHTSAHGLPVSRRRKPN